MTYRATIEHHSISRARVIECGDDLAEAKRRADEEFGDEQRDYVIAIFAESAAGTDIRVATRYVDGSRWEDLA